MAYKIHKLCILCKIIILSKSYTSSSKGFVIRSQIEHLRILNREEIELLYGLPHLDHEQQDQYFYLTPTEQDLMASYRSYATRVYFILQLGYFKARQQFFVFDFAQVMSDVRYILRRYSPMVETISEVSISRPTRLAQQQAIMQLFSFQPCTLQTRRLLLEKAKRLARIHSKPIYIFRELVNYLQTQRTVLPGYSIMQRFIVGKALSLEKTRLEELIEKLLTSEELLVLYRLIEPRDGLYLLTSLQQEPSNFNYQSIRGEVKRKLVLQPIYELANRILPQLDLSNENIRYYGQLADYYTVYKLKRRRGNIICLYLVCFVQTRLHRINDILVDAFRFHQRVFEDAAKAYAKEQIIQYQIEANEHLSKIPSVLELFTDPHIPDDTPFRRVRKMAFEVLPREDFPMVSRHIRQATLDSKALESGYYDQAKRKLAFSLRYLFLHLTFLSIRPNSAFIEAVRFLQQVSRSGKRLHQINDAEIPIQFIPVHRRRYLYAHGRLNEAKYEALIYEILVHRIEAGEVFIAESSQYKSFDQDLIPVEQWADKRRLLKELDLPALLKPIDQLLSEWESQIEELYQEVNQRISRGQNEDIVVLGKGETLRWQLHYKETEEPTNHYIYQQLPPIRVPQLLQLVDNHTNFLSAFSHLLEINVKKDVPKQNVLACLVAFGTNHGLGRMADISDINYYELAGTAQNYLRRETLQAANDYIINATAELPMFEHYYIREDTLHSSSDGQKYSTQFETINSRYSSKYFGLSKGVTAYALVANHIPVNAKIIGANEHESHYVFDLLFNNTSDVDPRVHSTDTHGTNQVNFAILNLFGYQFAPRYRKISSRAKMIYSFRYPSHYQGELLQPTRKINTRLLREEWDNIQRIIASLALKSTTQSTIIRKLSSYARKNRTKKALWEYDNIVRTHYILRYINSRELRKNVQKALSRGENYNRLRKHIFYAHGGKFRVHSVQEQQVWSECTRLIANCIIYYNTYLLSKLLEQEKAQGNEAAVEIVKQVSPIAWQHIHVYGTYQFLNNALGIDLDEAIRGVEINGNRQEGAQVASKI